MKRTLPLRILTATLPLLFVATSACSSTGTNSTAPPQNHSAETFSTTPTSTTAPSELPEPSPMDIDNVGPYVITTMFTWRPRTDSSPADAIQRATDWLSPQWVSHTKDQWMQLTNVTSSQWDEWASQGADDTRVQLMDNNEPRPPDTEMKKHRAWTVKQTIVGSSEGIVGTHSMDLFATFTANDGRLQLSNLHIIERS